jgi:putative ABC transport system permease protein
MRIFWLAVVHTWREWSRHPVATLLNVAGIAVGVALFVAIRTANESALKSFRASVDLVAGRADVQVVSAAGVRLEEEAVWPVVWAEAGLAHSTPVLEQVVMLPDFPGEYLRLVGVDLFSSAEFRTWQIRPVQGVAADAEDFLTVPGTVALQERLARRLGLEPGGVLRWRAQGRQGELRVLFTLEADADAVGVDEHVALMDVAGLQEMLGLAGRLDRVDCRLAPGVAEEEVLSRLQRVLPPGVVAQRPERRNRQVELMIGAFQLNLTALSLIALMVGAFLVYNTMANAVVRRRAEVGVLRAVGMSRAQVRGMFLLEAGVLGVVGSLLGLPLGKALAAVLVGAVSQTISSLYILLSVREVFVSGEALALGGSLGVLTAVVAAWFPAREASSVAPREALSPGGMQERVLQAGGVWLAGGLVLLGVAGVFAGVSLRWGPDWLSFVAAALLLLGFAVTAPWVGARVAGLVIFLSSRLSIKRGLLWKLTAGHFRTGLHRNAVTVAAMGSAVAMIVGIGVMVHSFRLTVDEWVRGSVRADLFVAPVSNLLSTGLETLPRHVVELAEGVAGAAAVDRYREVRLEFAGRPVRLAAVDFSVMAERSPLPVPGADARAVILQAAREGEVLVSSPFAKRFDKSGGDVLELMTPLGVRSFRVAGIFTDYTTDQGLVLMDWQQFVLLWGADEPQSLAFYLDGSVPLESFVSGLRERLAGVGDYLVYSNATLRSEVLRIFDQTFAVTGVLQVIGMLVAAVGVFLTATLLGMERRRELAVLRATGFSRSQVQRVLRRESVLVGVCAAVVGLCCGLVLAALLTYVINVAFFGWTISWATPWGLLAMLPFGVVVCCWLAAWWPAHRAAGEFLAEGLRSE